MKRLTGILLAVCVGIAADFRPPVPDVGVAEEKRQILQSCKIAPQMVVLPPMVEADYRPCANAYYKPDIPNAAYRLSAMFDKEVKVSAITIAEGFVRAYEINATLGNNKLRLLCDESVSACYEIGKTYAGQKKERNKQ
ncbi:MAG: hypothetical protein LBF86_09420 [Helicobacteraceae bacterium]|jgi:hypothetical protein|nr:hypothetical protein [Helicobacteraceae bacterium]